MLQGQAGQAHIRAVLEKHFIDCGIDPFSGEHQRYLHATAGAVQEILREYTLSILKRQLGTPVGPD